MDQVEYPQNMYQAEPLWTGLIPHFIVLTIAVPFLIWIIRNFLRAMSQQKSCLDHSITALEVSREAIETARESIAITREAIETARESIAITREAIEIQRETNKLLEELNRNLRSQPPQSDR